MTRSAAQTPSTDGSNQAALYRRLAPGLVKYLRASGSPDPGTICLEIFRRVMATPTRRECDVRRSLYVATRFCPELARVQSGMRPKVGLTPAGQALLTLPPGQREAILLRIAAGMDLVESARILKRPANNVRDQQRRGLQSLKRALDISGQASPKSPRSRIVTALLEEAGLQRDPTLMPALDAFVADKVDVPEISDSYFAPAAVSPSGRTGRGNARSVVAGAVVACTVVAGVTGVATAENSTRSHTPTPVQADYSARQKPLAAFGFLSLAAPAAEGTVRVPWAAKEDPSAGNAQKRPVRVSLAEDAVAQESDAGNTTSPAPAAVSSSEAKPSSGAKGRHRAPESDAARAEEDLAEQRHAEKSPAKHRGDYTGDNSESRKPQKAKHAENQGKSHQQANQKPAGTEAIRKPARQKPVQVETAKAGKSAGKPGRHVAPGRESADGKGPATSGQVASKPQPIRDK